MFKYGILKAQGIPPFAYLTHFFRVSVQLRINCICLPYDFVRLNLVFALQVELRKKNLNPNFFII
jgi:hypothetical protein